MPSLGSSPLLGFLFPVTAYSTICAQYLWIQRKINLIISANCLTPIKVNALRADVGIANSSFFITGTSSHLFSSKNIADFGCGKPCGGEDKGRMETSGIFSNRLEPR